MKKMGYLPLLLFLFAVPLLFLQGISKTQPVASKWAAYQMNIDGNQIDWRDVEFSSIERLRVDYAFKNDGENLFILFIFNEAKYLSSISATGMTIWFNPENLKKKSIGVKFTKMQVPAEAFIAYLEKEQGPLSEEEKSSLRAKGSYFLHNAQLVTPKKKDKAPEAPPAEEKGLAVFRTTRQRELMVYEFAIPLKRASEDALGIGTEPGKAIKVCFEWGGMTDEMKAAKIQRMQGASGGNPEKPTVSADTWVKSAGESMPQVGSTLQYSIWVDVQLAKNE